MHSDVLEMRKSTETNRKTDKVAALLEQLNDEMRSTEENRRRDKLTALFEQLNNEIRGKGGCPFGSTDRIKEEGYFCGQHESVEKTHVGVSSNKMDGLCNDGELSGLIFMCNQQTKEDCFKHGVFGLPLNRRNIVEQVVPGTRLFLFEYDARELWGIYEATSYGGLNIVPAAFKHSGESFQAQVRFKIYKEFPPLQESEFREAIKDNYVSDFKFKCDLNRNQILMLTKLFQRKYNNILKTTLSNVHQERPYVGYCNLKETQDGTWLPEQNLGVRENQNLTSGEVTGNSELSLESEVPQNYPLNSFRGNYVVLSRGDVSAKMGAAKSALSDETYQLLHHVKADNRFCLDYQNNQMVEPEKIASLEIDSDHRNKASARHGPLDVGNKISLDKWDVFRHYEKDLFQGYNDPDGCRLNQDKFSTASLASGPFVCESQNLKFGPSTAGNILPAENSYLNHTPRYDYVGGFASANIIPAFVSEKMDHTLAQEDTETPRIHEHYHMGKAPLTVQERFSNILSSEVYLDDCEKDTPPLGSNMLNKRASVWSRISRRAPEAPHNKNITASFAEKRQRDLPFQDLDYSDLDVDENKTSVEDTGEDEHLGEEYVISFKRRKIFSSVCRTDGVGDIQTKRKRKLIRPVFAVSAQPIKESSEGKAKQGKESFSDDAVVQDFNDFQRIKTHNVRTDSTEVGRVDDCGTQVGSAYKECIQNVRCCNENSSGDGSNPSEPHDLATADDSQKLDDRQKMDSRGMQFSNELCAQPNNECREEDMKQSDWRYPDEQVVIENFQKEHSGDDSQTSVSNLLVTADDCQNMDSLGLQVSKYLSAQLCNESGKQDMKQSDWGYSEEKVVLDVDNLQARELNVFSIDQSQCGKEDDIRARNDSGNGQSIQNVNNFLKNITQISEYHVFEKFNSYEAKISHQLSAQPNKQLSEEKVNQLNQACSTEKIVPDLAVCEIGKENDISRTQPC